MLRVTSIFIVAFATLSCAKLTQAPDKKAAADASPFGPNGIPNMLKSSDTGTDIMGNPISAAESGVPLKEISKRMTPDEDIFFTDPDNPYGNLPELSSIIGEKPKGPWEDSETIAKQRAMREGKPLLIWFTDSLRSPMDLALEQELFRRNDFAVWANENLVRLKVDSNVRSQVGETDRIYKREDREAEIADYVERLEKQYKIMGHPSLVMLNPSGEVIGRYRGYKRGDADYFWGVLKQAAISSNHNYKAWKEDLEKKGYRDWEGKRGKKIFAKLAAYSKGQLMLIEPDGTRSRTKEANLSREDRAWIDEQKRLRGLE